MNILHLITSLDKGGAESSVAHLSLEQVKKNNVSIFHTKKFSYWGKFLKKKKISIFNSKSFEKKSIVSKFIKLISDVLILKKIINQVDPDIVHVHLPYMEVLIYIYLFFKKKKFKLIITKHLDGNFFLGSSRKKKSFFGSLIVKLISMRSDQIIAISRSVKNFLISDIFKINIKKIKVIYYGIDLDFYFKNNKSNILQEKNKNNSYTIGTMSRLVPQKSLTTLIDALSNLIKDGYADIKLIIVGVGPLKNMLVNYAEQKKVNKNIIWIDFIENLKFFYDKIDIFCMTSLYEGFGLVFLEAMAFKKPIVATNTGAIKEIIINKKTGILFSKKNSYQLSIAIKTLMKKKINKKIVNKAYAHLTNKFTLDKMYIETMKIYLS